MNFKFHPNFSINQSQFSESELLIYAEKLVLSDLDFENQIGFFLKDWLNNNNFIIVKTSGTTGKPKEIKILKQSMLASAKATNLFFHLNQNNQSLLCLSAQFIAGKMMLVRAMLAGMNIDVIEPNSKIVLQKNYDFVAMVPLQAENSLECLSKIKNLIIGGAPLQFNLMQKLQKINSNIFETYGMTETITHIALKNINEKHFKTLPNITVKINDKNCLVAVIPYLNQEVITNDLVKLHSENTFEWLGRTNNTINSGGVKLQPEEIESILSPHIPNLFFVSSLPDDLLGEKVVLVVEAEIFKLNFSEIVGLNKYQKPKEIILVKSIKKTENGKIIRQIN